MHRDDLLVIERNEHARRKTDVSPSVADAQGINAGRQERHAVTRGYDVPPERGPFFAGYRCTTRNVGDGDGSAVRQESHRGRNGGVGHGDHRRRNEIYFTRVTTKKAGRELGCPDEEAATESAATAPPRGGCGTLSTFVFPFFLTYGGKRGEG